MPDTTPNPAGETELVGRWRFGDVLFDEREQTLQVGGVLSEVPGKSLRLLLQLLRHAGQVVTKEELAQACWPRRIITDEVLTTTLNRLRQGLGDRDRGAIQTVRGKGYRLMAPVSFDGPAPPPPQRLRLRPGDHPPQRPDWVLIEHLGEASQGNVWRAGASAAQTRPAEARVFKFAIDLRAINALRRELAISHLLHDVADAESWSMPVIDTGLETVPAFLATRWVSGGNLRQWMSRHDRSAMPPLKQRIELAAQCADALGAAHEAGLLHTNLKPGNILVDEGDGAPQIRLCDFGASAVINRERMRQHAATQFFVSGDTRDPASSSLMYIAPEIMAGESPSERSDVYSLGILLYQLVIGDFRHPLSADWEAEVGDELLREDISLCAAGDPQRRLGQARELARRLRNLELRRLQRDQQLAARAAAVSLVRVSYDGVAVSSRQIRHDYEREILAQHGRCILVYELQGRLSFDASDSLMIQLLAHCPDAHFLLVDLRRVTEVDEAAARRVAELVRRFGETGAEVFFTGADETSGLRPKLAAAAPNIAESLRFADIDRALQWSEDQLIAQHASDADPDQPVPLEQQPLCKELSAAEIESLRQVCTLRDFAAGENLFRVDDVGQSLYLIIEGRIDVVLGGDSGGERRLSGYRAGMPLGEIALITGGRRSADARAITPTRCYEVKFAELSPALQAQLLGRLMGLLARRTARDASELRILGPG